MYDFIKPTFDLWEILVFLISFCLETEPSVRNLNLNA